MLFRAHIHNTWEPYENLREYKGIKKVDNFIKQKQYESQWREVT